MACASKTQPEDLSSGTLQGGLLGFDQEFEPRWTEWSADIPADMEVDERLQPTTVFDVWPIDDPRFVEPLWDALFHLLGVVKNAQISDEQAVVVQSLMIRLDPGLGDNHHEISFVSQAEGQAEGIVLRIVSPEGPGIWLEAHRRAGQSERPASWVLRLEPAAREEAGLTVWWDRGDQEWQVRCADEAGARRQHRSLEGSNWEEMFLLLEAAFWDRISGRDYLEPGFEVAAFEAKPMGEGWPSALGETVQQREISDFLADTVFMPGATEEQLAP